MDYQKIYEALNTIKECCKENNYCDKCPLSVKSGEKSSKCKVGDISYDDIPRHWKLIVPVYKAFGEKKAESGFMEDGQH